jgi:2-polyprenyl-3-methyl-5-hydroxy-6-metoxy-1,4-benzoquinol methylase
MNAAPGGSGVAGGKCEVCLGALRTWQLDRRNAVGKCCDCGHVTRDLVAAAAGARSPAYGGDPGLDRWRLAITYRRFRRLSPDARRVFEVGFGTGALLRRFLDDGAQVSGADPGALQQSVDEDLTRRATKLYTAALAEVPRRADQDLVAGVHVIEHVTDVHEFVAACHDLLRPGGRLVLVTPAGDSSSLRAFRRAWWMLEDPTHVRFFTARSLTRLLQDAGFVDTQIRRLVLDSLAVEVASLVRLVRWRRLPDAGALSLRSTRVLVLVLAPLIVGVRVLLPAWRPVLQVSARRP